MTTNKTLATTATVTFALLMGLMASKLAIKVKAQAAAQSAVITYTLQQREVVTGDQGKVVIDETRVLAQRGDGTTVEIGNIPGGHVKSVESGTVYVSVTATDINNNVFTMGSGQPRITPTGRGCISLNSRAPVVGNETLLGYPVVHTRVQDDVMIDDRWFVKSLDCLVLRQVITWLDNGQPIAGQDIRQATSVTLGDPDPALFTLPANPVEVRPAAFAKQADPTSVNWFQNLEQVYDKQKAAREALGKQ